MAKEKISRRGFLATGPEGADGMSEEELAARVTRDSMVGVEKLKPFEPEAAV